MAESSEILIRNIFHMLCYAFKILRQQNYEDIATEDFLHVEDMLAAILCKGISRQLKQGLYCAYNGIDEQSRTLRGKVNLYGTKQLRQRKISRFDCSHDEFSADNELNQILKSTSSLLLHCHEVGEKRKIELRRLLPYFSDIADIELSTVRWSGLHYQKNNRSYEMLMNICFLVWQCQLPSTTSGKTKFSMFDEESLPLLYEKFILEYYGQHFPMLHPSDKTIRWNISEDTEPSAINQLPGMHSDIMLTYNGQTHIIDAKFYRRSLASYKEKEMLRSANLYQIFAYVKNEDDSNTGNVSGLLLYARTTEEAEPHLRVRLGNNLIEVKTLDLNRPFNEISASLDNIALTRFGSDLIKVA